MLLLEIIEIIEEKKEQALADTMILL